MDKSIYEKQSDPLIIQCLFAQRKKYSQAKLISEIYFIICVLGVCTFLILKAIFPSDLITVLSTVLSVIAFAVSFLVKSITSKLKETAAGIQQYIDTTLYKSNQYSSLNSKWTCPFTKDQIIEMVSKYPIHGFTENDKWYEDYSTKSFCEQIYYSQYENLRWDYDLRKYYSRLYKAGLCTILGVLILYAIILNLTVIECISILAWCLPFIKFYVSFNNAMKNDDTRLTTLKNKADNIMHNVGMVLDGHELICLEIELQNKLYEHRQKAVLIPDFIYKLFRNKQQKNEEKIANNHRTQS